MTDIINAPPHYIGNNGIEVRDVILGFDLTYNLGTVVAYVLRCQTKGALVEDLRKAIRHLEMEIEDRSSVTRGSFVRTGLSGEYGKQRGGNTATNLGSKWPTAWRDTQAWDIKDGRKIPIT